MHWIDRLSGVFRRVARIRPLVDVTRPELLRPELERTLSDYLRPLWDELGVAWEEATEANQQTEGQALYDFRFPEAQAEQRFNQWNASEKILRFLILEASLADVLGTDEPEWSSRVELAFLHLNRTLAVDRAVHLRWLDAWSKEQEPALEKLGGIHLLSHGLFGFKASATGQQTDLVLGSPVRPDEARRAAAPLVLTEWKKVPNPKQAQQKVCEARSQLQSYGVGTAAALELRRVRYAVLVSKQALLDIETEQPTRAGWLLRVLNVVVAPETPSRLGTRASRNLGRP